MRDRRRGRDVQQAGGTVEIARRPPPDRRAGAPRTKRYGHGKPSKMVFVPAPAAPDSAPDAASVETSWPAPPADVPAGAARDNVVVLPRDAPAARADYALDSDVADAEDGEPPAGAGHEPPWRARPRFTSPQMAAIFCVLVVYLVLLWAVTDADEFVEYVTAAFAASVVLLLVLRATLRRWLRAARTRAKDVEEGGPARETRRALWWMSFVAGDGGGGGAPADPRRRALPAFVTAGDLLGAVVVWLVYSFVTFHSTTAIVSYSTWRDAVLAAALAAQFAAAPAHTLATVVAFVVFVVALFTPAFRAGVRYGLGAALLKAAVAFVAIGVARLRLARVLDACPGVADIRPLLAFSLVAAVLCASPPTGAFVVLAPVVVAVPFAAVAALELVHRVRTRAPPADAPPEPPEPEREPEPEPEPEPNRYGSSADSGLHGVPWDREPPPPAAGVMPPAAAAASAALPPAVAPFRGGAASSARSSSPPPAAAPPPRRPERPPAPAPARAVTSDSQRAAAAARRSLPRI